MSLGEGMAGLLAIRLFGPFEVRHNGLALPRPRTRKAQWLLALLALRGGIEVERTWLAGMLWTDSSEVQALTSLRNSLADLRQVLGTEAGRLRSPSLRTLSLDLTGADVDVLLFDEAIARGDVPSLEKAVSLYRGPLLQECGEAWAFQERQAREQAYLTALETLAADAMAGGEAAAAERHLRSAVAVDPLRETAQRALMQALAAGGNYAAALLAYRELRLLLHQELNAEPDPETQALFRQIREEARRRGEARPPRHSSKIASPPRRSVLPPLLAEGTITFLFTDVEDGGAALWPQSGQRRGPGPGTRPWEERPEAMRAALARHNALLRHAIGAHLGVVFKTMGDAFCAAFATAPDALAAALAAQRALQAEAWGEVALTVRMALHTGTVEEQDGDYFGPPLNRIARLLGAGHGGQILLSDTAADLTRDHLPEGASLRDLGQHRLKDLERPEHVFQLLHSDLPAAFPPLRSLEAFAHNLPVQLTSFIGREREMAEVKRLLPTTHLLTLTGAGGCGKTRLALQVAADLLEGYADGVWLVELAALTDPALVPQAVASALGVREEGGGGTPPADRAGAPPPRPHSEVAAEGGASALWGPAPGNRPLTATLADALRSRTLLLLLDNCEHLLAACAQLTETLLRSCPNLRVLATSREGLGVAGEMSYLVPPLSLPSPASRAPGRRLPPGGADRVSAVTRSEAGCLFVERAHFIQPGFAVTPQNAAAVEQVCYRLDGIPLAIELAAARVKVLPVEQVAARLDDMFRLLTGGSRTALPRQQTLRALIDWSYDLLSELERGLLRRLSVFSGGWTLEAAEAVCAGGYPEGHTPKVGPEGSWIEGWDVLDLLTQLVDKSLVGYEEHGGEARYRLLETVRQYARDRLLESGEAERLRGLHRDFFLTLAEEAEPELHRSEQVVWLDRLEAEHDNLRAVLDWCQAEESGAEAGLRLAGALAWFWVKRGYFGEGRQQLERALSRDGAVSASARAKALLGACNVAYWQGDYELMRACGEESLALARSVGDKRSQSFSLFALGLMASEQGDTARATPLAEESLALAREVEDKQLIAYPLITLAAVATEQGDTARAMTLLTESLALCREAGNKWLIAILLENLGGTAQHRGDYEQARALYIEGLGLFEELGNKMGTAVCLEGLAGVAGAQGQVEQAARLMGTVEAIREALGTPLPPADRVDQERILEPLRTALGEAAFAAAWEAGRAMSLEQAIASALQEDADPLQGDTIVSAARRGTPPPGNADASHTATE